MQVKSYKITEVENWDKTGYVEIPAMQRGLVWAPNQVELLWDSILRGFPIGAFVFTPIKGNENQSTKGDLYDGGGYFLLDGQQRYTAIKAAFTEWTRDADARSVLWIDFMPPSRVNTSRRYWVKVTTKAHPWGFANNDECSTLGWAGYRDALDSFVGCDQNMRVQDVPMSVAWPVKARCPVPFADVLRMQRGSEDSEAFVRAIRTWCESHGGERPIGVSNKDWEMMSRVGQDIYEALRRLETYEISVSVLEPEVVADQIGMSETDVRESSTSNLEQLFTRLNTLGTPISPYDLRYSAIKAYWGEKVRVNDDIAARIMPGANLAVLAFRLALTIASDKMTFADVPSIAKIRSMGLLRNDPSCKIVDELYANDGSWLARIIEDVEQALQVYRREDDPEDGLPAVLRTSIIVNSPDVYLLLMYMAYRGKLTQFGHLGGLATWLHWFSVDSRKRVVDRLRPVIDKGGLDDLKKVLRELAAEGAIMRPVIVTAENFGDCKKFQRKDLNWSEYESQDWYPLFDAVWSQREMVYFATRQYFNKTFQYDPAETKFFTGHNRPWDMDHIVPKHWVSRQGVSMGEWQRQCLDWIWSVGNFAPISFSANRAKRDRAEWDEYKANAKNLLFDERIDGKRIRSDVLTSDDNMAKLFIEVTHGRLVSIYENWRKTVEEFL